MTCNLTASQAAANALAATPGDAWVQDCVQRLDWDALLGSSQGGLLGEEGTPMSCFNNDTWGISKSVCDQFCSIGQMPISARFDWMQFGTGFNSYFLPWVALTAQLPFQTGALRNDLMSVMLAVGSPTLITFSLGITISNRRWAKRRFDALYEKAKRHPPSSQEWILHRIRSMAFLLEEAQQEPLRINDRDDFHAFASQAAEADNWAKMIKRLHLTRRGLTASLVTQNLVAIVAWTITVVSSSYTRGEATPTAAGVLWMWLTPVVCGWVVAGVQTGVGSVEEALNEAFDSPKAQGAPFSPCWNPIRGASSTEATNHVQERSWVARTLSPHGDELRKGPLYNYARAATWWKFARSMEKTANALIDKEIRKQEVHKPAAEKGAVISVVGRGNGSGEAHVYPPLGKFLAEDRWRLVWPAIMALFVQLGNTFGAFVMGYQTLPVGLGCNSGGYLLYGIGSTVAWMCLVGSALMSHEVQYRRERGRDSATARTRALSLLACATLVAGKFVAVLNCLWLVFSTMFELGGLYNTCYCYSSSLGLGKGAWAILWQRDTVALDDENDWWTVGVSLATLVCIGSMILFVFLAIQGRLRKGLPWR